MKILSIILFFSFSLLFNVTSSAPQMKIKRKYHNVIVGTYQYKILMEVLM